MQLIVLAMFGAVGVTPYPLYVCPCFEISFKWQLLYYFDIMEYTYLIFLILVMHKYLHVYPNLRLPYIHVSISTFLCQVLLYSSFQQA